MPIPSLYKKIPAGYLKAHLSKDCFLGIEHGKTIGIAFAVCKDVAQSWDGEWDLYFPPSELDRVFAGRSGITTQRLKNILEEEAAAALEEEKHDHEVGI